MLQAVEAEISPDGRVTLREPVHLSQAARAIMTILAPLGAPVAVKGSGLALLTLLDSPAFAAAPAGAPVRIEQDIAANRDAWGD